MHTLALAAVLIGVALGGARATPMLLVEADTGKVLEQQDAGKPWYPASVTKLMTVYVSLNAMRQGRVTGDSLFTVSALAASQSPTKMGFGVGTKVTLDNALKMLMVKSANDMAVVIAEGVGGNLPDFIAEMNDTAEALGMSGTHFENPNGLPDKEQYTTARDLAILARALIFHFPEHEMLFRLPAIRLGKVVMRNYNRLIDRYPGADGMKTGFICASGFNLVATATRDNKRLIAVILGAPSAVARTEQAALLFEKGFQPSWSIFGAASPTLEGIVNVGGTPTDMNVCNRKRAVAAAENEDDNLYNQGPSTSSYAVSAAIAAGFSKGEGAALLQNLPPSMPPVRVFVGPAGTAPATQDEALGEAKTSAAKPDSGKPKQKTVAVTPGSASKDPAKATISTAPIPAPKPAAKPAVATTTMPAAAKPAAAKPAKPAASPKPAADAKPKPANTTAAASGAAGQNDPLTFGPPPPRPGT
ncbi:D-alanyl-D-alanine carboxypeptidase family protein [Aquabacter spiritensis]|uniref:D-alanyl-D-alanine carboxypeptidase family protein n=1 Tax=Aquabacter spiritensis TaxID=933073 RepID=UPI0030841088